MPERIGPFFGEYRWLSNFWPSPVRYEGLLFPTVEHAYQAAKCLHQEDKIRIQQAKTPVEAKRMGRRVALRPDWEQIKLDIMRSLLRQKFAPDTKLAQQLIATGDTQLVEINTWGDYYWGVCNGKGENHLGRLLMEIREELKKAQPVN